MTDSAILAEMKPCGLILASHLYKFFALQCVHCRKKYGHWATFMRHLKEMHQERTMETEWIKSVSEEQWEIVMENDAANSKKLQTNANADDVPVEAASVSSPVDAEIVETLEVLDEQIISGETIYEIEAHSCDADAESYTLPVQYEVIESNDGEYDYEHLLYDAEGNNDGAKVKTREFQLDFTVEHNDTLLFIQLYKCYPCLWQLYQSRTTYLQQRASAKNELLTSLTEHNFIVSMGIVEHSIAELHKYVNDITRRLEEGLEISDLDEKYYDKCDFLKPFTSFTIARKNYIEEPECLNVTADTNDSDENSNAADGSQHSSNYLDFSEEDNEQIDSNKLLVSFSCRNRATCDFILWFREHPCLWNPQDHAYDDVHERLQALTEIKDYFIENYKISFTEYSLRSAIKRLLNFYKRCCRTKRNLNSIRYFYYERCAFLAGIDLDNKVVAKCNFVKKITFESMNQYTLDFIDLCHKYPVLWDSAHPDYSVHKARQVAYNEMSAQIQKVYKIKLSKDELYDAIYKIKQCYISLQEKKQKNKPLTKSDLIYLERGKFLPTSKLKVQCYICDSVVRSELTLQIHLLKKHNIGELPFKCDYCEQRFAHRAAMKEHEVRTHTKQYDWLCQYCNKGFANRRDKGLHELVHTGARNCICEHCGKSFRLKHQMTEHVKIVHERMRRFKCTLCEKNFLRKNQLNDHIRSHLNIRDKVCNICGKAYTNFNALFRHKQLHSDVKRYVCKICDERFHQYVGLSLHMKRKHELIKDDNSAEDVIMTETVGEVEELPDI